MTKLKNNLSNFPYNHQIKQATASCLQKSGKKASLIAAQIFDLTGLEISVSTIYNWTSPTHPHVIPPALISTFCIITKCNDLLQILTSQVGGVQLIDDEKSKLLEIFELKKQELKAAERQAKIWNEIELKYREISGFKEVIQ